MRALRSAFDQEPSCPLLARLRANRLVCWVGEIRSSSTRRRSFGKSIKNGSPPTTMRWNFPDGRIVLLTCLREDQEATVLQLPAQPRTAVESEAQQRAAYVG